MKQVIYIYIQYQWPSEKYKIIYFKIISQLNGKALVIYTTNTFCSLIDKSRAILEMRKI